MNAGFVLNQAAKDQTMSAAISNQWWATNGLLTEQVKAVRKKLEHEHTEIDWSWKTVQMSGRQEIAKGGHVVFFPSTHRKTLNLLSESL